MDLRTYHTIFLFPRHQLASTENSTPLQTAQSNENRTEPPQADRRAISLRQRPPQRDSVHHGRTHALQHPGADLVRRIAELHLPRNVHSIIGIQGVVKTGDRGVRLHA